MNHASHEYRRRLDNLTRHHRTSFRCAGLTVLVSCMAFVPPGHASPGEPETAPRPESTGRYDVLRTEKPILIDGSLAEDVWLRAPRSPRFVDMITGKPGLLETRAAALWDDQNLYVAFWVTEPFVRAAVTRRDATVFRENDVEVFIDGVDTYYEFEINALNTVYEVFFIWKDAYARFLRVPEFDLLSRRVFTFGGNHDRSLEYFWEGKHPRGTRWAFADWDFQGLKTAVQIQGSLNDDSDVDQGWTVELAFPWSGMRHLAQGRSLPPKEGEVWRFFFGRFQKLEVGNGIASPAWSWDPVGDNDNHAPEKFTPVRFQGRVAGQP